MSFGQNSECVSVSILHREHQLLVSVYHACLLKWGAFQAKARNPPSIPGYRKMPACSLLGLCLLHNRVVVQQRCTSAVLDARAFREVRSPKAQSLLLPLLPLFHTLLPTAHVWDGAVVKHKTLWYITIILLIGWSSDSKFDTSFLIVKKLSIVKPIHFETIHLKLKKIIFSFLITIFRSVRCIFPTPLLAETAPMTMKAVPL